MNIYPSVVINPHHKSIITELESTKTNFYTEATTILNTNKELCSRKIFDTEPTETEELTALGFTKLLKKKTFSNKKYIVNGDVTICSSSLKNLPPHIIIKGDISLKKLPKLKCLPYDFAVTGNIEIDTCANFDISNEVKYKLNIGGKLIISNCNSLSQIPSKTEFPVHIFKCKNYVKLLAGKYEEITIENCSNFCNILTPTYINTLSLIENKKFVELPNNLTVGNFNIISCPIKALVNEITIEGDLLLKNLTDLNIIHNSNVKLTGNITIDNCLSFLEKINNKDKWPDWIVRIKPNGFARKIYILGKIEIPILIIESADIFSVDYIASNFNFFRFSIQSLSKFFIQLAEDKNRISYPYVNYKDLPSIDKSKLFVFLYNIEKTSDFRLGNKSYLATQIVKIIALFEEGIDANTYVQAMEIVDYATSSCVDRITLALDDLLILLETKEAMQSRNFDKIRETIKNNIMIGVMDSIAMKKIGDQIETILVSRFYLRDKFNLLAGIQQMRYSRYANITNEELHSASKIAITTANSEIDKIMQLDMPTNLTAITPEELIKKQKTLPDYHSLSIKYVDEIPRCEIMLDHADKMVEYNQHFYGYDAFFRAYQESGKDPFTSLPIDTNKIYKVVIRV